MADRTDSPPRGPRRDRDRDRRPKPGAFKWKDNARSREDDRDDRRGSSYRNRSASPRRRDDRPRDNRDSYREDDNLRRRQSPPQRSRSPAAAEGKDKDKPEKTEQQDKDKKEKREKKNKDKKDKKDKKPKSSEPMIIVHVNDRLGTKAAIPCFASDRIKEFKILVAARIGREPHEILLKRQGERPFKDILSLADYGVSNGVQLDLEVDTAD